MKNTTTHYQTSFRVVDDDGAGLRGFEPCAAGWSKHLDGVAGCCLESASPRQAAFQGLQHLVHKWLCEREPDAEILRQRATDFFYRCDWPGLPETHSIVRTSTYLSRASEAWAMRYLEQDQELGSRRFWQWDVGLSKQGADVVVALRVSYAWHGEDLSPDRPEPRVSVPRLMRLLLQHNRRSFG